MGTEKCLGEDGAGLGVIMPARFPMQRGFQAWVYVWMRSACGSENVRGMCNGDHVRLKGRVDVTRVSMCAPRQCGILCLGVRGGS